MLLRLEYSGVAKDYKGMRLKSLFALSCFMLAPSLVLSQNITFQLLPSVVPQPTARFDGTIAYDSIGHQVYLFGGQDDAPENDLWAYSISAQQWTKVAVQGDLPPARFGHTMIFDPVRRRVVVFGGQAGTFYNDVWAFDIAGGSWKQLNVPFSGPATRYGHSGIYDSKRDRMVISHGFTHSGRFDDTWAFDFATNAWSDISPAARPLRRCLHHAAYDPAHDQMYLYGGCSSGYGPCPDGDLWSLDFSKGQWTERTPISSPAPREHYGMAFDEARGKLVLFGGDGASLFADLWEFDPNTGLWLAVGHQGNTPSARNRHEATWAADLGAVLFFGGATNNGLSNELWSLGAGAAVVRPVIRQNGVLNSFTNSGGPVAPGELVSIYGTALGPLTGNAFAFDAKTGRLPVTGQGVTVTFNGIAAPLLFVRGDQVNVQVPYELQGGISAAVKVSVNGQDSDTLNVSLNPVALGLYPGVFNQDGTVNAATNPAAGGSIVVLYATGQGVTSPVSFSGTVAAGFYPDPVAPVALQIGGADAQILFRGQAPGTTGVMQINARIPAGVSAGDKIPVKLTIGGVATQTVVAISK